MRLLQTLEQPPFLLQQQALDDCEPGRRRLTDLVGQCARCVAGGTVPVAVLQPHAGRAVDRQREGGQTGPPDRQRQVAQHHQDQQQTDQPQQQERQLSFDRQLGRIAPIHQRHANDQAQQQQHRNPGRHRADPRQRPAQVPVGSLSRTSRRQTKIPFPDRHAAPVPRTSSLDKPPRQPAQQRKQHEDESRGDQGRTDVIRPACHRCLVRRFPAPSVCRRPPTTANPRAWHTIPAAAAAACCGAAR